MPVCFFAHPNEIQLDLASLTSSNWKHITLMYKVEKRMQLKTSGTWNDILVTALTTQPGQWPRNASSTGAGLQNTLYYRGKNSPPAYTSAGPHMSRTFEQVSFPLSWQILLRALWELSRAGSLGPIGQMQTKLEPGNVEEFSLRIRIRIINWLSGFCCKSNPCDNWDVKRRSWSRSTPGVGLSFSEQSSLIWNVIHLSGSVRADSTGQHWTADTIKTNLNEAAQKMWPQFIASPDQSWNSISQVIEFYFASQNMFWCYEALVACACVLCYESFPL